MFFKNWDVGLMGEKFEYVCCNAFHVTYNMKFLICFTQETIIIHLQRRYEELQIYTYVGDILIAVNPFQALKIYSPQVLAQHAKHRD